MIDARPGGGKSSQINTNSGGSAISEERQDLERAVEANRLRLEEQERRLKSSETGNPNSQMMPGLSDIQKTTNSKVQELYSNLMKDNSDSSSDDGEEDNDEDDEDNDDSSSD